MDSHRVQIMDIRVLFQAMVMGMMNQNMKIMVQRSIPMDMEVLSQGTHKWALNQAMPHNISMVSHNHTTCHHRDSLLNLMVLRGLLNLGTCLIKVLHLPNHMALMHHLNSLTHINPVPRCSKHMLPMVQLLVLMGMVSHQLPLARFILSKEHRQVMVSLVHSR